jgi:hypothetical protein
VIDTYRIKRAIEAHRHQRWSQLWWKLRGRIVGQGSLPATPSAVSVRDFTLTPGMDPGNPIDVRPREWAGAESVDRLTELLWRLNGPGAASPHRTEMAAQAWQHAVWLSQHLPQDRPGHLLLRSLAAVLHASLRIDAPRMDLLRERAAAQLCVQLREQFLDDGGHFQRSPGYHADCVGDLLDIANLQRHAADLLPTSLSGLVAQRLPAAIDWLVTMTMPNGKLPPFNDSPANGVVAVDALLAYAARLGIVATIPAWRDGRLASLTASGYFVAGNERDRMVIDCGEGGPAHLLDHAHCDVLSYELALGGRRVIIDAGTYEHAAGPRRRYSRSTAAHNTVAVDGEEQLEFYRVYEVAWRARPIAPALRATGNGGWQFTGAHDGYCGLPEKVVHHRRIDYDGLRTWSIHDELRGAGTHRAESFIHLHPELRATPGDGIVEIADASGTPLAVIEIPGRLDVRIERRECFPRPGEAADGDVIILTHQGATPLEFGYRIIRRD